MNRSVDLQTLLHECVVKNRKQAEEKNVFEEKGFKKDKKV